MEKIVNKTCIKNLKESGAPIIIVAAVKEAEAHTLVRILVLK